MNYHGSFFLSVPAKAASNSNSNSHGRRSHSRCNRCKGFSRSMQQPQQTPSFLPAVTSRRSSLLASLFGVVDPTNQQTRTITSSTPTTRTPSNLLSSLRISSLCVSRRVRDNRSFSFVVGVRAKNSPVPLRPCHACNKVIGRGNYTFHDSLIENPLDER